jgi:tetratricopeptide (TPR) repeat protein
MYVQKNARWSTANLTFDFRLANAFMSYVRYLSKIFYPTNLALIYPYPHSWPIAGVVLSTAVLALLSLIFIFQIKRFPYLAVGWFWFLGTLVPAIGLVQVGVQSMADRYTYLPSIGIFILAVWGISDLLNESARKTNICILVGGGALIGCLMLTLLQLRYWQNSLTLFIHTYAVTDDNYAADDCLGVTLYTGGKFQPAQKLFEQAISLEPTYPMAQFDLGMDLLAQGDSTGASNHLATAIQLYPANPDMQYDFGVFLWQHGNFKDAAAHFNAALAIRPDFPQAREKLDEIQTHSPSNQ